MESINQTLVVIRTCLPNHCGTNLICKSTHRTISYPTNYSSNIEQDNMSRLCCRCLYVDEFIHNHHRTFSVNYSTKVDMVEMTRRIVQMVFKKIHKCNISRVGHCLFRGCGQKA